MRYPMSVCKMRSRRPHEFLQEKCGIEIRDNGEHEHMACRHTYGMRP